MRPDRAIAKPINDDIYTDEVNTLIELASHSIKPVMST